MYTAGKAFIASVVPAGVPIIQGLGNRVSIPPPVPGFVAMTLVLNDRLRTNLDTWDPLDIAPTSLAAEQGLSATLQMDVYSANAFDWANMLSTLWRDDYACAMLTPACQPLYADEARLMPLLDSENQYESRYMVNAKLQMNPVTTFPMQYANVLGPVDLINVDVTYPAH